MCKQAWERVTATSPTSTASGTSPKGAKGDQEQLAMLLSTEEGPGALLAVGREESLKAVSHNRQRQGPRTEIAHPIVASFNDFCFEPTGN